MTNIIQDTIIQHWHRARAAPNGWLSGNAVCCHHNGHRPDTRGRGGIVINDNTIAYSCFNCNFKASYRTGKPLSFKMRRLLSWMGVSENHIKILVLEAIRLRDTELDQLDVEQVKPNFAERVLPENSQSFNALAEFYLLNDMKDCPNYFLDAVAYVADRGIDMSRYEFYWSDTGTNFMNRRVIVPFQHQKLIVGYSARTFVDNIKPKYIMNSQPGYVFNLDQQKKNWKTVIICEGIFDALSLDGVAVMHNDISEMQADQIDDLSREVVVVPDWDASGKKLLEQAIKYNWSVSFPVWRETCKDINEAVRRYGKLFVLKDILDHVEYSSLKIQLWSRKTRWNNA